MIARLWITAGMGAAPVIELELPPGLKLTPEVLIWNCRVFKLKDTATDPAAGGAVDYAEVFALEVRS